MSLTIFTRTQREIKGRVDGKREAAAEESGERSSLLTFLGFPVPHSKRWMGFWTLHPFGWGPGYVLSLRNSVHGLQGFTEVAVSLRRKAGKGQRDPNKILTADK